jgi:DNA polymerase-3 subunit epsilon
MRNYVVLDLETANADCASICQFGAVLVRNGEIVERHDQLVDPDDYFDPFNIGIHGIDAARVMGSPRFPQAFARLSPMLSDQIVVTHGAFDRVAISRAADLHGIEVPALTWLDNQRVVRRTWPEFSRSGYALGKLVRHFGIPLRHHDALEDATATAKIFEKALAESGKTPLDWLDLVERPINGNIGRIERDGADDGPFAGEVIVFTGALTMPRQRAADEAARVGFDVAGGITKRTTLLCVGVQDRDKLAGYEKSSKHRKAEELISEGYDISIIGEDDFFRLISGPAVSARMPATAKPLS